MYGQYNWNSDGIRTPRYPCRCAHSVENVRTILATIRELNFSGDHEHDVVWHLLYNCDFIFASASFRKPGPAQSTKAQINKEQKEIMKHRQERMIEKMSENIKDSHSSSASHNKPAHPITSKSLTQKTKEAFDAKKLTTSMSTFKSFQSILIEQAKLMSWL